MTNPGQDALSLKVGDRLLLSDGAVVEVTENPRDGVWLFCRYLSSPDGSLVGSEDQAVFATDVVGLEEPGTPA